jgi:Cof subfamily protein (haloacid dehalogenase superfamily)
VAGGRATAGGVSAAERRPLASSVPPPISEYATDFVPKLAVLDVDGTLIDQDLELHPRIAAAVAAAARRLPVILATGRMYRSVLPWARQLGITEPLVCYQGALVRELPDGEVPGQVLLEETLPAGVAVRAIEIARTHDWHRQAYVDDELLCEQDRPEAHFYARIAGVPIRFVDDLAAVVSGGSTKIVCVSEDRAVVEACIAAMSAAFGERARVTRSMEQFVEMSSPLVNKATATELVCRRAGLSLADAVAVGDAPNDVEMLEAAGCGVAVRHARDEVLAAADATCGPPDQAGVADVLEHFGLTG